MGMQLYQSALFNKFKGMGIDLPPKLLLAKELAANEEAAYSGYASTRKVKMPLNTRRVLLFQSVSYSVLLRVENMLHHV